MPFGEEIRPGLYYIKVADSSGNLRTRRAISDVSYAGDGEQTVGDAVLKRECDSSKRRALEPLLV